ncbi:MAG: TolC family protein [Helicobacter sp.]|nr:TolC family protein [Helicobacter sp.]
MRALVIFIFCIALSFAEETASLRSLFAAVQKSEPLRASVWLVEKERAKKDSLKAAFFPKIGASVGAEQTNQPSVFQAYRTLTLGLQAEWNLFDGFRSTLAKEAQESLLASSVENEESTRQKLYLQVIEHYYGYFKAKSLLQALAAQQHELEANLARLERFYENGLSGLDALEALRAQIAQNAYQRNSAILLAQTHSENLEWLTQKPFADVVSPSQQSHSNPCELPDTAPMPSFHFSQIALPLLHDSPSAQAESMLLLTPSPSAELRAFDKQLDALHARIGAYNYLPKVDVFARAGYYHFDKFYIPKLPTLPFALTIDDSELHGVQATIGLQVVFPLFDTFAVQKEREAARYEYLSAQSQYQHQLRYQSHQVKIAQNALENARQKITWTKTQAKSARIAYCYAQKKFQTGLISHTEYLTSLATDVAARASFEESFLDYEMAKAQMIFASGGKLEDFIQ